LLRNGTPLAREYGLSLTRTFSEEIKKQQSNMKHILLLLNIAALLATTGCIFPGPRGGGYHERGEYRGHREYRGHADYREQYPEPAVDIRIHAP
jgi:hypothetical protein